MLHLQPSYEGSRTAEAACTAWRFAQQHGPPDDGWRWALYDLLHAQHLEVHHELNPK